MKKILKDPKVITLIGILLLFTIFYFVSVNKLSYAFSNEDNSVYYHNQTINIIKEASKIYASNNVDLFKDNNIVYIKVQDLIDNGLLAANEEGKIIDILTNDSLNNKVIKIKNENNNINIEIDN